MIPRVVSKWGTLAGAVVFTVSVLFFNGDRFTAFVAGALVVLAAMEWFLRPIQDEIDALHEEHIAKLRSLLEAKSVMLEAWAALHVGDRERSERLLASLRDEAES